MARDSPRDGWQSPGTPKKARESHNASQQRQRVMEAARSLTSCSRWPHGVPEECLDPTRQLMKMPEGCLDPSCSPLRVRGVDPSHNPPLQWTPEVIMDPPYQQSRTLEMAQCPLQHSRKQSRAVGAAWVTLNASQRRLGVLEVR